MKLIQTQGRTAHTHTLKNTCPYPKPENETQQNKRFKGTQMICCKNMGSKMFYPVAWALVGVRNVLTRIHNYSKLCFLRTHRKENTTKIQEIVTISRKL